MAGRGIYLTALGAGVLIFWSGFKGWGILSTAQDIITGKQPAGPAVNAPENVNPLTSQSAGIYTGGTSISADAMQYQGHAYVYGGAPGRNGAQPWDCSSFVNWVVSHDLNLPWPGAGQYDGTSHGPPTGLWGPWLIAKGLRVPGGIPAAQAGDIVVWAGHMGICIGPNQMISALDPADGTKVTPIQGYGNGPLLCVGRYQQAPNTGMSQTTLRLGG